MQQLAKINEWLGDKNSGVEIGAFKTPLPGISPIYVDKFKFYANERCYADFHGEAISLPFRSNSLEYVAASHVIEHVANPIQAWLEWYRVLRPGGLIYMVVPDRRFTWEHSRALTPVDHFFQDFAEKKTAADGTHIDEFIDNIDWSEYGPNFGPEAIAAESLRLRTSYHAAVDLGNEINIHFHVFEPSNLRELITRVDSTPAIGIRWQLVDLVERFPDENPNGILAVMRVKKSWRDRLAALAHAQTRDDVILPSAKKFD